MRNYLSQSSLTFSRISLWSRATWRLPVNEVVQVVAARSRQGINSDLLYKAAQGKSKIQTVLTRRFTPLNLLLLPKHVVTPKSKPRLTQILKLSQRKHRESWATCQMASSHYSLLLGKASQQRIIFSRMDQKRADSKGWWIPIMGVNLHNQLVAWNMRIRNMIR